MDKRKMDELAKKINAARKELRKIEEENNATMSCKQLEEEWQKLMKEKSK